MSLLQSGAGLAALLSGSATIAARVAGLVLLSAVVAAVVALVYRWYAGDRIGSPVAVLVGLSSVALYLNTTVALSQVIAGSNTEVLTLDAALFNVVAFVLAAAIAPAGARAGDRVGTDLFAVAGAREFDADVSNIVRTVGRVITVELPEEIEDIEGYDPVDPEVKAKLAGRTFVFPRRLTVNELRERLVDRLVADFRVGHVDADLNADGTVDYLAVGSRAAGIGPTLPPEHAAVAVHADPAFAASPGDRVQVWHRPTPEAAEAGAEQPEATTGTAPETAAAADDPADGTPATETGASGPTPQAAGAERLATAEVRGVAGDVVTLAVDASDVGSLDAETRYRLVTLPADPGADRAFASLLRAADETMGVTTVEAGSALDGAPVSAAAAAVIAVRPADGTVEPLPSRSRALAAGDTVYAVGLPDALRRLETAARAGEA